MTGSGSVWSDAVKLLAGTAGYQLAGVVMLPLLTRLLSPAEIGLWDLVQFCFSLGPLLIGLEIPTIVGMRISKTTGELDAQGALFTVALKFMTGSCLVLLVMYILLGRPAAAHWLPGLNDAGLLLVPLAVILATAQTQLVALAQHAGFVGRGSAVNLSTVCLNLLAVVSLIVLTDAGVTGLIVARAVSAAVGVGLTLVLCRRLIRRAQSLGLLPGLLRSSLPLVPYSVAFFILLYGDRLVLTRYVTLGELGIYAIAFRVSMVGFALISAVTSAYVFEFYRMDSERRVRDHDLKRLTQRCGIVVALVVLIVVELSPEGLRLLAPPSYGGAADLIPWLLIGQGCFGILSLFWLELIARERTAYVGIATVLAAATNIAVNVLLVPSLGILGAAVAQLVSYALLLAGSVCYLQRQRLLVSGAPGAIAALLVVSSFIGLERGFLHLNVAGRLGIISVLIVGFGYVLLRPKVPATA